MLQGEVQDLFQGVSHRDGNRSQGRGWLRLVPRGGTSKPDLRPRNYKGPCRSLPGCWTEQEGGGRKDRLPGTLWLQSCHMWFWVTVAQTWAPVDCRTVIWGVILALPSGRWQSCCRSSGGGHVQCHQRAHSREWPANSQRYSDTKRIETRKRATGNNENTHTDLRNV